MIYRNEPVIEAINIRQLREKESLSKTVYYRLIKFEDKP